MGGNNNTNWYPQIADPTIHRAMRIAFDNLYILRDQVNAAANAVVPTVAAPISAVAGNSNTVYIAGGGGSPAASNGVRYYKAIVSGNGTYTVSSSTLGAAVDTAIAKVKVVQPGAPATPLVIAFDSGFTGIADGLPDFEVQGGVSRLLFTGDTDTLLWHFQSAVFGTVN